MPYISVSKDLMCKFSSASNLCRYICFFFFFFTTVSILYTFTLFPYKFPLYLFKLFPFPSVPSLMLSHISLYLPQHIRFTLDSFLMNLSQREGKGERGPNKNLGMRVKEANIHFLSLAICVKRKRIPESKLDSDPWAEF